MRRHQPDFPTRKRSHDLRPPPRAFSALCALFFVLGVTVNYVSAQSPAASRLNAYRHLAAMSDIRGLDSLAYTLQHSTQDADLELGLLSSATAAYRRGERRLCLRLLDSLQRAGTHENRPVRPIAHKLGSVVATDLGQYPHALKEADLGLALVDSAACPTDHVDLLVVKAEALLEMQDHTPAHALSVHAHTTARRVNYPRGAALALLTLGNIAFRQERYETALRFYQDAMRQVPSTARLIGLNAASNLAGAAVMLKQYTRGARIIDSLIASYDDQETEALARLWGIKGYIATSQGSLDSSIIHLRTALQFAELGDDQLAKVKPGQNLANALWKQGQRRSAITTLYRSSLLARSLNQPIPLLEMHKKLAKWYADIDLPDSAYLHAKGALTLADSINKARFEDQLALSAIQFETVEKERRIAEQEQALQLAAAEDRRKSFQRNVSVGIAALLLLIAALLYRSMRTRKRLAEKEKELHGEQVDQLLSQQEIKSINAMLEGQEKERDRVGKDLHDRLGSMLGGIKAQLGALEDRVVQVQNDAQFQKVNRLLDETVGELRQISHDMAASTLSRFGLEKALKDLRDTIHISGRLSVELSVFGLEQRLERSVEIAVYRIVQELVSNVLKHAKARELSIDVTRSPGRLSVIVSDNGLGFDTGEPAEGMGLGNVRSRAAALGATVRVDSAPGTGTTVSVECPVVE